jgi:uncharacterized protein (TIGR02118 family)
MVKVIVLLQEPERTIRPNDYATQYNGFLMLLEHMPKLKRKAVCSVYAGPGGMAVYNAVVELYFETREDMQAALTSPEGVEAGQALLKFAGTQAIMLFADVLEESYS